LTFFLQLLDSSPFLVTNHCRRLLTNAKLTWHKAGRIFIDRLAEFMSMENLTPDIRNAVRAVIVRNDQLLLLRKSGGERGERYALPGGAQNPGETLAQALNRECLEEIGAAVEILALMNVADHFKARATDPPGTRQMVEFLFRCSVPDDYVARNGSKPDRSQLDVVWVDLADLAAAPLDPASLSHWLPLGIQRAAAVYLGLLE